MGALTDGLGQFWSGVGEVRKGCGGMKGGRGRRELGARVAEGEEDGLVTRVGGRAGEGSGSLP